MSLPCPSTRRTTARRGIWPFFRGDVRGNADGSHDLGLLAFAAGRFGNDLHQRDGPVGPDQRVRSRPDGFRGADMPRGSLLPRRRSSRFRCNTLPLRRSTKITLPSRVSRWATSGLLSSRPASTPRAATSLGAMAAGSRDCAITRTREG